jgi:hypothetical protein
MLESKKGDFGMKDNSVTPKIYIVFVVLLLAGALSLAVGLLLRPWFAEQSVEAARLAQPAETNQANSEAIASTIRQPGDVQDKGAVSIETPIANIRSSQSVNHITISIDNYRREQERILIDVCFDLPDASDWTMWNALLKYGGKAYEWSEMVPIEIRKPPADGKQQVLSFPTGGGVTETWVEATDDQKGYRCETIYFDDIPSEPDSNHYIFTIDALEAAPKEGEECTQAYLEKAQSVLDANKTGITVKCVEGEYTSGLGVAEKPTSMSMEEAQSILSSEDFYLALNGIKGPWTFEFEIK